MPCIHRFHADLLPPGELRYLFVGTFNPSWNRPQGDDASWFYGRQYNDFWYIMPQLFGHDSLMARETRTSRQTLFEFFQNHHIGITDLIHCVNDADENNVEHQEIILSVNDNGFDQFEDIDATDVVEIVNQNHHSLRGVYLTRRLRTLNQDGILRQLWNVVTDRCEELRIHSSDLVTPSRHFRQISRDTKLEQWREVVNIV